MIIACTMVACCGVAVLWRLGFLAHSVGGSLSHLPLVIAVIIPIYQLLTGRRRVEP